MINNKIEIKYYDKNSAQKALFTMDGKFYPRVLAMINPELFENDREWLIDIVQEHPEALEYIPESCKDKELILMAINIEAYTLEHAGEKLRNDKEVVLAAINQKRRAIAFAGEELMKDTDFRNEISEFYEDMPEINDVNINISALNLMTRTFNTINGRYGIDTVSKLLKFKEKDIKNFCKLGREGFLEIKSNLILNNLKLGMTEEELEEWKNEKKSNSQLETKQDNDKESHPSFEDIKKEIEELKQKINEVSEENLKLRAEVKELNAQIEAALEGTSAQIDSKENSEGHTR